jgi:hypothetical protein
MRCKNCLFLVLNLYFALFFATCKNSTGPKVVNGTIKGMIKNVVTGAVLVNHPAYIFIDDSLYTTTDKNGNYSISGVREGSYSLLCSSLFYLDSTSQVHVRGGKTVACNFALTPDSTMGRVYGEFEDVTLFNESLKNDSSLASWDARRIWMETTGATIQMKTLEYDVPDRNVFLGDSLLATTDGFGQFWFNLQAGTYCIRGTCEGYQDATQVIKVLPGTRIYSNIYLRRVVK